MATGDSTTPHRAPLKRTLGMWMATALVVGNMIGSGVFSLPSALASIGPVSLLGWVLTGAGSVLLAFVFANLARAYPRTGGPYAYARRAFGDFMGFWTAWGYWIAVWAGNAAIATSFVAYLAVFWPEAGSNHALAAVLASGAIWLLTLVNIAGAREGGIVQLATTIVKFVPLALIGVVGLFYMSRSHFTPFAPDVHGFRSGLSAISAAGALTLWAFIGLESATVAAEEVRDPKRTIVRATIIGTIITTFVYIIATVAVMGVVPQSTLLNSASPFADAASIMFGGGWDKVVAAVAIVSTLGALNGWILLQGRVPLAAADDGLFPRQFSQVSGKRGTPVFGLVVSSMLVTVLMATSYNNSLVSLFTQVILLATLTTVIPYAFSAAAQLLMLIREPELFDAGRAVRDAIIAILAFGYSFWMIYGVGEETVAKGFLLLAAGIPVYVWLKWQERRNGDAGTPAVLTNGPAPAPRELVEAGRDA
jgi:APA family basic amino acid/polyamine antiporter